MSPCPSCGALLHVQIELGTSINDPGFSFRKKHPLYDTWRGMIRRCYDPRKNNYHRYGGRGIKVCQRWLESFEAFLEDVGPRPSGHTLDRKDNDGDYEPDNIRWATLDEQHRVLLKKITLNGRAQTWAEWVQETGLSRATLHRRIKEGWTDDEVINGPSQPKMASFSATARQYGMNPNTLKARLDNGLTMEEAVTLPPYTRKASLKR